MATNKLTLSVIAPDSGIAWSVKFSTSAFSAESGINVDTGITTALGWYVYPVIPTPAELGLVSIGSSYIFKISSFSDPIRTYSSNDGVKYTSFKYDDGTSQFPISGLNMDIFSDLFLDNINKNMTWTNMSVAGIGSTNTYTLYSNKNSLVYNYDFRVAPCWSRGGTLAVTIG